MTKFCIAKQKIKFYKECCLALNKLINDHYKIIENTETIILKYTNEIKKLEETL